MAGSPEVIHLLGEPDTHHGRMEDGTALRRRHHTPEQIVRLLAQGEKLLGQS